MRDFIYLDMNRVNSIIAQSENGVLNTVTTQEQSKDETGKEMTISGSSATEVGGGLKKIARIEESINLGIDFSKISSKESLVSQIKERSIHDAAFAIAYEYLKPSEFCNQEEYINYGTQIELSDEFRFVDLEFLDTLFSDDGVLAWSANEDLKKAESSTNSLPRDQKRNPQLQQKIKDIRKAKKDELKGYQDLIRVVKKTLPFTRMLVSSKGLVVPLNDSYFRDDPQIGIFKYGGTLTCVGTITNRFDADEKNNQDMFSQLYDQVFDLLKVILELNVNPFYILNPIAVFYSFTDQ